MEGEQRSTVSEWNQQVAFDYVFNTLASKCRDLQIREDVIGWARTLEALYIHCEAILDKKESDDILNKINQVRVKINEFQRERALARPTVPQKAGECYIILADLDLLIRRYANKHSPFLNQRKEHDYTNF